MDNKPTYRPWESRYSPNNRAVREAQQMAAQDRACERRIQRDQWRAEEQAATLARFDRPADRAAAHESACALVGAMGVPRRCNTRYATP